MTAHEGGRERKTKRWGVGVSVRQGLSLDSKKSFMLLLNNFNQNVKIMSQNNESNTCQLFYFNMSSLTEPNECITF